MSEITIVGRNQFKPIYVEKLFSSILGDATEPTVSLCHVCYSHIPAWKYHKDNSVYMVKHCATHGISHHKIENDYEFYSSLFYTHDTPAFTFNGSVLMEASDRCNLECPHCYHLPDSSLADIPLQDFMNRVKQLPIGKGKLGVERIVLSGAEATLRKDFHELVAAIGELNLFPSVMTNGIRFGDRTFVKNAKEAGLKTINVGLNHPDYIDHEVVRKKQVTGLDMMHEENMQVGYISYTMIDLSELDHILNEIINSPWTPKTFRIRAGSEIGRNSTEGRIYLSDIFKSIKQWAEDNNKHFKIIGNADDNIYHIMVELENKIVRVIQWCDITDIDCEELRSGPWCDFVPDGITNFLHQIIRRDVWKNQGKILPDEPPERYKFHRPIDIHSPLDFFTLYR